MDEKEVWKTPSVGLEGMEDVEGHISGTGGSSQATLQCGWSINRAGRMRDQKPRQKNSVSMPSHCSDEL